MTVGARCGFFSPSFLRMSEGYVRHMHKHTEGIYIFSQIHFILLQTKQENIFFMRFIYTYTVF